MNIYNPLSKKQRRKKQAKARLTELTQQKALNLCLRYEQQILYGDTTGIGNAVEEDIVVSLTSFAERLDKVAYTIESLMQQTLRADRILLCLGADRVKSSDIPLALKRLEKRGLEIRFCAEDLGPYTKFFYSLQDNPNSLLITVDDDILYPFDMIEKLYSAYCQDKRYIYCHRGHKMHLHKGQLSPYKQWEYSTQERDPSYLIFPTGVGGVLYFPGALYNEVLDKDRFLALCPKADDVWLKAMSLKQGVACKTIRQANPFCFEFPAIIGSQEVTLKRSNKQSGGNDAKIKAVFEHYDLYPVLTECCS